MSKHKGVRNTARASAMVAHGVIREAESCTAKVPHLDRNSATAAAKSLFQRTGRRVAVYRCPFAPTDAPHWHLTKVRHGEDE